MGVRYKKDKGNYLENRVAELFRIRFNLSKDDVHRAQSSGNFSSEYGDIYFRKHRIIIECKNQQSVTWTAIFPVMNKTILKFYKQLEAEIDKFTKQNPDSQFTAFLVVSDSSKRFKPLVIQKIDDNTDCNKFASCIYTVDNEGNRYICVPLEDYLQKLNIKQYEF